jgi:multisubunit Na+/H+ antiporter MnhG subunit
MVEDCGLETLYSKINEGTTLTSDSNDFDEQTSQSGMRTSLALIRTIDSEKRTHLAELRTGIGILTIPLSLLTILIATSNYYSVDSVLSLIVGLVIGIVALASVGAYLVIRSLQKLRKNEKLRDSCKDISCFLEEHQNSD